MRPRRHTAGTRLTRWARVPRAWLWLALVALLAGQSGALFAHELEHAHAVDADCLAYHVVVQPPLAAAMATPSAGARPSSFLGIHYANAPAYPRPLLRPPLRAPPLSLLA